MRISAKARTLSGSCVGIKVSRGTRPREAARKREGCVVPEHWNTDDDQGTNDSFQERNAQNVTDYKRVDHQSSTGSLAFTEQQLRLAPVREQEPLTLGRVFKKVQWTFFIHSLSDLALEPLCEYAHAQPAWIECTCPHLERDNRHLTPSRT